MTNHTTPASGAADLPEALYADAVKFAKERASISYVQRKCRCSYNKAERMLEQMVADGIIQTYNGRKDAALTARAISAEPAAHVQNPAENEHVADDMSKNGAGSNAPQPVPPADSVLEDAVHQVFMDRGWHDVPASDLWMYPTAERWQVRTLYFTPQPTIPQPIQEPVVAGEPVAWKEYAQHLEWCRTCAEDAVGACHEGSSLKVSAMAAPTITPQPTPAQAGAVPLTEAQKREIATNWFAEDWAVSNAIGLIDDYETLQGITKEGGQP